MANIHPSHYFNSAEYYLHNANGPKNCQEIEDLIKKDTNGILYRGMAPGKRNPVAL